MRINGGYDRPHNSLGFHCAPALQMTRRATIAHFTCKLQGADVPTSVRLTFRANRVPPSGG